MSDGFDGPDYRHGGDIFGKASKLGLNPSEILDFSASINPMGMPPAVQRAIVEALPLAENYPEPYGESLVTALASHTSLPENQIMVGAGTTELIHTLFETLGYENATIITPAFGQYTDAANRFGIAIEEVPLSTADFIFKADVLEGHDVADRSIWLTNPGSPHGVCIEREEIEKLLNMLPDSSTLVIDEAFIDFVPEKSLAPLLNEHSNLIILRSLTKFYAMPGIRVGYLLVSPELIARLQRNRQPWQISTLALAAGKACLDADDYREESIRLNIERRAKLSEDLAGLGFTVVPGEANFLLLKLPKGSGEEIAAVLEGEGILIRRCESFPPLDDSFIRVAAKDDAANGRLVAALKGWSSNE